MFLFPPLFFVFSIEREDEGVRLRLPEAPLLVRSIMFEVGAEQETRPSERLFFKVVARVPYRIVYISYPKSFEL